MEKGPIEVLLTRDHVVLVKDAHSLWCSRKNGALNPGNEVKRDSTFLHAGYAYGIVGKVKFFSDAEWKLLLITEVSSRGTLPHWGEIFCIEHVTVMSLIEDAHPESSRLEGDTDAATHRRGSKVGQKEKPKEIEKLEKRLIECLLSMFNDSQSFYYCTNSNLTQSFQRRMVTAGCEPVTPWMKVDERFFWNKWMLSDLIEDNYAGPLGDPWIIPVIQGYVECRELQIHSDEAAPTYPLGSEGGSSRLKTKPEAHGRHDNRGHHGNHVLHGNHVHHGNSEQIQLGDIEQLEALSSGANRSPPDDGVDGYESDLEDDVAEEANERNNEDPKAHSLATNADQLHTDMASSEAPPTIPDPMERVQTPPSMATPSVSPPNAPPTVPSTSPPKVPPTFPPKDSRVVVEGGESAGEKGTKVAEMVGHGLRQSDDSRRLREGKDERDSGKGKDERDSGKGKDERDSGKGKDERDSGKGKDERDSGKGKDERDSGKGKDERDSGKGKDERDSGKGKDERDSGKGKDERDSGKGKDERDSGKGKDERDSGKGKDERDSGSSFVLAVISRRSRHRAGMRYLRRGIDEDGYVANYVETEMVILVGTHMVTYNIVRGSVPVYWTQPGIKYRPNPIVQRSDEETQKAFAEHFKQELDLYRNVAIVNLVNQRGMEQALSDAYRKHALQLDNPFITYIEFDFNMHNKTDGVGSLVRYPLVEDIAKRFKFSWADKSSSDAPLCNQEGIFRVNCMDCLDRTNVVQSMFARSILLSLLRKLGLLHFEEDLSGEALQGYKEMWANNGDVISRQYTGTAAMKGDLTRYGERKIMGMMKDGYYSANRYYQSNFRDVYKQVVVDLMQGSNTAEAFATLPEQLRGVEEEMNDNITPWSLDKEEHVVDSIIQCRTELYPDKGLRVQGWMLSEAAGYSFADSSLTENDCVVLHCAETNELCVISYKTLAHQIVCFIRIPMQIVQKVVIGPVGSLLNSSRRIYMRVFYNFDNTEEPCYFTFKTVNFTSLEEDKITLKSIADTFALIQPSIVVQEQKLTRKRSPKHQGVIYLVLQQQGRDYDGAQNQLSEQFNEEALEASLSAPSSPEPRRKSRRRSSHHAPEPLQERRSQSFDNLLHVPEPAEGSEKPLGSYAQEISDSAESDDEMGVFGPRMAPVEDASLSSGLGDARRSRPELPVASALALLKGKAGKLFKKVKGHPDSTSSEQEDSNLKPLSSGAKSKFRDPSPSGAGKVGPSTKPTPSPPISQSRYVCI